jgi:hypothetical protein
MQKAVVNNVRAMSALPRKRTLIASARRFRSSVLWFSSAKIFRYQQNTKVASDASVVALIVI